MNVTAFTESQCPHCAEWSLHTMGSVLDLPGLRDIVALDVVSCAHPNATYSKNS